MTISDSGIAFTIKHEGFVSRAYRDPVGVWTIGPGFTNGSKVAVRELGKIGPGMTITREQSAALLRKVFAEEYEPAVTAAMTADGKAHHHDVGCDYCFNCGTGAMSDSWVGLFNSGNVAAAASRLRTSRATAKGVRLRGLVARRADEARLLETGDYGLGNDMARSVQTPAPPAPDADIMPWQQKLKDLGYYQGKVDGWHGPMFTAAVTAFQRAHPNLKPDGIMGPATIAAIQRASDAKAKANSASVVIVGATSAATVAAPQTGLWIALGIGLAGIVLACVILWSHRDEVQQYLNKNATG